tara:strand:+ start:640 stop:804 length:165 start_codon:yes stop_codon:yes gene_type:complete
MQAEYVCKICKRRYVSEQLVKLHLMYLHDIPSRKMIDLSNDVRRILGKPEKEWF